MEVASALLAVASRVTVVTTDSVPFQLQLGERVGKFLRQWHESKGIRSGTHCARCRETGVWKDDASLRQG